MAAHEGISGHQFKGVLEGLHGQLNVGSSEGGGFSKHMVTGKSPPSEGYMVAQHGTEEHIEPALATRPHHLARYVRSNRGALAQPGNYFGGWKPSAEEVGEGEPDFVDLDTSRHITARSEVAAEYGPDVARHDAAERALTLGIAHRQKAIWDLKGGRSIDVR